MSSYLRVVDQHLHRVVGEVLVVNEDHLLQQNAVLAGRGEQAATQRELHTPDGALVVAAQVAVSNTS